MTELEQLRKEVNELRERIAVLERKQTPTNGYGHFYTTPVYPPSVRTLDPQCGIQPCAVPSFSHTSE